MAELQSESLAFTLQLCHFATLHNNFVCSFYHRQEERQSSLDCIAIAGMGDGEMGREGVGALEQDLANHSWKDYHSRVVRLG